VATLIFSPASLSKKRKQARTTPPFNLFAICTTHYRLSAPGLAGIITEVSVQFISGFTETSNAGDEMLFDIYLRPLNN
jgi:hypothetical protein